MAVGKPAPIPATDICVASAAACAALEATVAEFTEALQQVNPATLRRRMKKFDVVAPTVEVATNGFAPSISLAKGVNGKPRKRKRNCDVVVQQDAKL